jgi:hypothetical protein
MELDWSQWKDSRSRLLLSGFECDMLDSARNTGETPMGARRYPGVSPMWVDPHGRYTGVTPGRRAALSTFETVGGGIAARDRRVSCAEPTAIDLRTDRNVSSFPPPLGEREDRRRRPSEPEAQVDSKDGLRGSLSPRDRAGVRGKVTSNGIKAAELNGRRRAPAREAGHFLVALLNDTYNFAYCIEDGPE